jgi:glycogen(starch) synthase
MHVLVTSDTVNGIWSYTRELVSGLVKRGFCITLVSFGDIPLSQDTVWIEGLSGLEYRPTAFRLDWMEEGRQDFQDASAYLCSLVKERKPDLLHSNHLGYGALPVPIPRIIVAHGDLITWWKAVHGREPSDSLWLRWYRQMIARGISHASMVVTTSQWMLNEIRSSYRLRSSGTVIHHGRNPILFNPYVSKEDTVLAIGRMLDPARQVNLLTEREHPVPVCIVGASGDEPSPRRAAAARRTLTGQSKGVALKHFESESQLRLLYSRAGIYAGTSRYEPSGMNILEAALSRCALILNDIPPLREIWGDTAVYFERNDAASLAEAVCMLSRDRQLRRSLANRAYLRARECFNAHRMVESYARLYENVVDGSAKAV